MTEKTTFGVTSRPMREYTQIAKPARVPSECVFLFDYTHVGGPGDDIQLAWRRLRELARDIFWTPCNGGHWVATRADDIETIQRNFTWVSYRDTQNPRQPPHFPFVPTNVDPPQHYLYRRLIMRFFQPRMLDDLEAKARTIAIDRIEQLAPRAGCESTSEFARVLPATVFLGMANVPMNNSPHLLKLAETITRAPNAELRMAALNDVENYLDGIIRNPLNDPGRDILSQVIHSTIDGRPITAEERFSICTLLLVGGLNTVASMMGFIARFFALNPRYQEEIRTDPLLVRSATEEPIRRHGVATTAPIIAHDFVYKDVQFN